MGYLISDEGKDLLKDVHDFCTNEVKEQIKEFDVSGEWAEDIYNMAIEMQLGTLDVPEEFGGPGLSRIDHAAILEEMAKADAGFATSFMANGLSLHPVELGGTKEQMKACYDIILKGGFGAFCLTEPNAGCDVANGSTTAVRDGDDYIINGTKCFITNGPKAEFFTVFAKTDKSAGAKGMTAFLVFKGTSGLSIGSHENKMGIRASQTSDVIFEDVRVPASAMLGKEGDGFKIAMKTLDIARTWCGVVALGIAQRAIDESAEYVRTRVQFGKPLGRNEVIQFKLADMEMETEAARQLCAYSLTLMDRGEDFSTASAIAKCKAGDAAMNVSTEAVQILGGYGYSRDYPVEKLMRDAKIFQLFEGTNEIQRLVVGRSVVGKC